MPLKPGSQQKSISDNISELIRSGRTPSQAVAIALSNAAKASPKAYANGGDVRSSDSDNDDEAAKRKKLLGQIINFPGVDPTPVPTPKAYADGGDVVLPDVPPMSTSVSEALPPDQLQKLLAVRDELPQQPGGPLLPDWAADAAAKERLPVPTQSEAGFRMIGEPTGGSVATVPEETGLVRRAAMPEVIDTTGRTVGEEAAPSLLGAAGELASKAALPLTAAYEFLKSTPAGTGEDDLMRDRQAKAAAAAGGKPGDANGPSLFDMVSDKYKELTPQMTAPAPAAPARGTSGQVADSSPVSAPAPTSTPPTMNPLLAKYLQDRMDMKDAVDKANTNRLIAGISGAAGQLAASTYGATKPVDEAGFKALEDNASAPVTALQTVQGAGMKSLEEQQALMKASQSQDADNPNSVYSQRVQAMYAPIMKRLGMPTDGLSAMSATDIKEGIQSPADMSIKMKEAEARVAEQRELAMQRLQYQHGQIDEKEAPTIAKGLNYLTASSRSALGSAANAKTSVARLAQIAADPNATPQDMENVYADLNRVVSNTTTESGTEHQAYNNFNTQLAKLIGYATSNPTAADIPEVKQHIIAVARGMDKISDSIIDRNTKIVQTGHQGWISRHPDQWQAMVDAASTSPAAPAPASPAGTVKVTDPTGKVRAIPQSQVQDALAAGGKLAQ